MTIEIRTEPMAPTGPRPKTTADVLRHAARIIEERGHCRNGYVGSDGEVCAWGAINVATFGMPRVLYSERIPEAIHVLSSQVGPMIGRWNDIHTAAEVIATLRAAADAAEQS